MEEQKKSKRNYWIIILIALLLALAIGYAAFSEVLTITGTASGNATWDIKLTDVSLSDDKHGTASVGDGITGTATVTLAYPGDGVMLSATVTNAGTVPAELTSFSIVPSDSSNKIAIDPTGESDKDIIVTTARPQVGEEISADGGQCTTQYFIQWNPKSTSTEISAQTFTITFNYSQLDDIVTLTPQHTGNHNNTN